MKANDTGKKGPLGVIRETMTGIMMSNPAEINEPAFKEYLPLRARHSSALLTL